MLKSRVTVLVVAVVVSVATAHAAVVNGGFETGDFTGWGTLGVTAIATNAIGSGPPEGNFQAFLFTAGNGVTVFPATAAELVVFTGVDLTTAIDFVNENGVYVQGSAIAQTFSASAGQILSFDWNFLTNEERFVLGGDFAFVTITPIGETTELADALTTIVPSATFLEHETGFLTFSRLIPVGGVYRVAIGLADVVPITGPQDDPFGFDSGLLVDNLGLNVVPEPASMALMGLGLAGMAGLKLRRKLK
jgi:hypothetical protein